MSVGKCLVLGSKLSPRPVQSQGQHVWFALVGHAHSGVRPSALSRGQSVRASVHAVLGIS